MKREMKQMAVSCSFKLWYILHGWEARNTLLGLSMHYRAPHARHHRSVEGLVNDKALRVPKPLLAGAP